MSEEKETSFEELAKKRAYKFAHGGVKGVAFKLEGFKSSRLAGMLTTVGIGAEAERAEKDDWVVLVEDQRGVQPIDVWAKRLASEISNVSGSNIGTVSVPSAPAGSTPPAAPSYETLKVDNEEDLEKAYAEGWRDPVQYTPGKWMLRRPKFVIFTR
jgi:hypothetical protein